MLHDDLQQVTVSLDDKGILHIDYGMAGKVTEAMVREAHRQHLLLGKVQRPVLISGGRVARLDYDAQRLASSPEIAASTLAVAILARNFLHHHLIQVFSLYHRPAYPVRVFSDRQRALAWLQQISAESKEIS